MSSQGKAIGGPPVMVNGIPLHEFLTTQKRDELLEDFQDTVKEMSKMRKRLEKARGLNLKGRHGPCRKICREEITMNTLMEKLRAMSSPHAEKGINRKARLLEFVFNCIKIDNYFSVQKHVGENISDFYDWMKDSVRMDTKNKYHEAVLYQDLIWLEKRRFLKSTSTGPAKVYKAGTGESPTPPRKETEPGGEQPEDKAQVSTKGKGKTGRDLYDRASQQADQDEETEAIKILKEVETYIRQHADEVERLVRRLERMKANRDRLLELPVKRIIQEARSGFTMGRDWFIRKEGE